MLPLVIDDGPYSNHHSFISRATKSKQVSSKTSTKRTVTQNCTTLSYVLLIPEYWYKLNIYRITLLAYSKDNKGLDKDIGVMFKTTNFKEALHYYFIYRWTRINSLTHIFSISQCAILTIHSIHFHTRSTVYTRCRLKDRRKDSPATGGAFSATTD